MHSGKEVCRDAEEEGDGCLCCMPRSKRKASPRNICRITTDTTCAAHTNRSAPAPCDGREPAPGSRYTRKRTRKPTWKPKAESESESEADSEADSDSPAKFGCSYSRSCGRQSHFVGPAGGANVALMMGEKEGDGGREGEKLG